MNSIDQFELDILDGMGIDQATLCGSIARWAVETTTAAVADVLGLNPDAVIIDYRVLAGEHL